MIKRAKPEVGYIDGDYIGDGISTLVRHGNIVHLAGITAMRGKGEVVAADDMAGQVHFILDIMGKMLATEDMTLANVVMTTLYTVDMARLLECSELLTAPFAAAPPASTFVEVKSLASPGLLLEVAVTAAAE